MSHLKRATACLIAAFFITNCAASAQKRSFGEVISDEAIAFSLKTKYMKDRQVPANDIAIGVWKGIVTLKGEIERQEEINRAIEIAEQQKGVKEVKAFLVLKEYGRLQDSDKTPFYKKWFKSSDRMRRGGNKARLHEKDLTEGTAPASPPANTQKTEPTDRDDLDSEEEF
jgi:hypothetical protein